MKRLKKAILLPVRRYAHRRKCARLYYWAEQELAELRTITVMPRLYYRALYRGCMRLNDFSRFRRLADKAIHTIPYQVRFDMA
jgi:hypothetical protein